MQINAIITGVTGMVGEGVLSVCLNHPDVKKILLINRKPCGISHTKITEIIHSDFFNLSAIEDKLAGYNACFFCLGVTSIGKKEPEYFSLTHTLTLLFANTVVKLNNEMTFCYISGVGTDSSEKGSIMWARVKGKTENDLMKLPFKKAFAFRPGYIQPIKGLKNSHRFYSFIKWMYPFWQKIFPKYFCSMEELAIAMINSVKKGYEKNIMEVKDIVALSEK